MLDLGTGNQRERTPFRQEKEREQILIELNKLKEKILILEKELSEYKEEKDQLVKELVVVNKNLIEIEALKMEEMINNRFISQLKYCKNCKV